MNLLQVTKLTCGRGGSEPERTDSAQLQRGSLARPPTRTLSRPPAKGHISLLWFTAYDRV